MYKREPTKLTIVPGCTARIDVREWELPLDLENLEMQFKSSLTFCLAEMVNNSDLVFPALSYMNTNGHNHPADPDLLMLQLRVPFCTDDCNEPAFQVSLQQVVEDAFDHATGEGREEDIKNFANALRKLADHVEKEAFPQE